MKVVDDFYQIVFVFKNDVLNFVSSVWERDNEKGEQKEQFFLDSFVIVGGVTELLHDILQIFFVIYKIIRKFVIESLVYFFLSGGFIFVHAYVIPISFTHVLLLFTFIYLVDATLKSQHQNFILKFHTLPIIVI